MAYLAILQPDARVEARLRDALGATHRVARAPTWSGLDRLLTREPIDVCVMDADFPSHEEAVEEIRRLRRRHPWLALLAYTNVHRSEQELYQLGGLGVDDVVQSQHLSHPEGISDRIERSLLSSRASRVGAALEGRYGAAVVQAVGWAVEHGGGSPTVADFASSLGQSPRGLALALRANGLPSPSRLLLWGRLLLAGAYLGREGRTVEQTALALGYSTGTALARAMKRETGWTALNVAERGGMAFVWAQLFPRGRARRRMPNRAGRGAVVAMIGLLSACATGGTTTPPGPGEPAGSGEAPRTIDDVLDRPPLDQVHFGVLAIDGESGRIIYARDAEKKFVPASNQKLLVTAAAISLLGADYRYDTAFWSAGNVRDSTLHGDLVLKATGDPTLSRRYWKSGEGALVALADSLRTTGIRRVTGALVVDVSGWDSATVGPTREVEDLRFGYGAAGGAFTLEEGEIQVIAEGGPEAGTRPRIAWTPVGTPDFVTTHVETAPPDSTTRIVAHYLPESRRLVLEGRVTAGRTDTLAFAARDPVGEATTLLTRVVAESGVDVLGGSRITWDAGTAGVACTPGGGASCPAPRRLAGIRSPPLSEILAGILGPSQNWMAEQLTRTLGAEKGTRGSWSEGVGVAARFLVEDVGVDSLDFVLRDGSGLSAYNLVTPRALVQVLEHISAGSHAAAFRAALAEPGEEDSTLEDRLPDLIGRVFAKTGVITNVNSLSGYLVRDDGGETVFSILSNGSGLPSARMREAIDQVVTLLAGVSP